ncbi:hypothetical protein [Undibacterium sp. CY21W]|uniref:hypothetical protein n=1 Tax=Undibacterium sp. CY21W TaxID=2762293 RepID=UPI00164B7286|nr:hypothetical protein [Undibacterium sp. CY21W]MBC3927785.1 hypothetical protein [Undibacterium sp. CY21W]
MSAISVRGVSEMVSNFNEFTVNQAPFAMARALTATAKAASAAVTDHIAMVFDQPTTFTKRAMGFSPADKTTLKASVYVKDIQASYLVAEMDGGLRGFKTFEEKFGGKDAVEYAMPGKDAKRNSFGNMTKAQIVKLANQISDGKNSKVFRGVSRKNPALDIIYARTEGNTKLVPQLVFTKKANYKPIFKFEQTVSDTAASKFVQNFQQSWDAAVKSMKR